MSQDSLGPSGLVPHEDGDAILLAVHDLGVKSPILIGGCRLNENFRRLGNSFGVTASSLHYPVRCSRDIATTAATQPDICCCATSSSWAVG